MGSGCCSGSVNHRDNPRLWTDHNQAKMSLDEPARRSNIEASAEPAVKSPSSDGETALMRAAARGDVAGVRRRLDERGGETPVAGQRL